MKNENTKPQRQHGLPLFLKIAIPIISIGFIVLICFYLGLFPTFKFVRQRRAKTFSDDKTYSVIVGHAQLYYYNDKELFITVNLDEVLTDNYGYYNIGLEYNYHFTSSQCEIINSNGFQDLWSSPLTNDYGSTYYEVTLPVTMTVSNIIWGDGMSPFAVALSAGDKEFLSYETGKEKLINYILYEMY